MDGSVTRAEGSCLVYFFDGYLIIFANWWTSEAAFFVHFIHIGAVQIDSLLLSIIHSS